MLTQKFEDRRMSTNISDLQIYIDPWKKEKKNVKNEPFDTKLEKLYASRENAEHA